MRADHSQVQRGPAPADALCPFCGQPQLLDIHEAWGHEYMLEVCCEQMREHAVEEMAAQPRQAGQWAQQRLGAVLPPVRRIVDDQAGSLILDFHLQLVEVSFREVRQFVQKHHRHCAAPAGWKFGIGVVNGSLGLGAGLLGVVSCGRPVARALDQQRIVEVNRLCIDPTAPAALAWNAASMLYGWSARKARAMGADWIITYTLESEAGTSLRAAGWIPGRRTPGRSWNTASRPRDAQMTSTEAKTRWHKQLASRPRSSLVQSRSAPHMI